MTFTPAAYLCSLLGVICLSCQATATNASQTLIDELAQACADQDTGRLMGMVDHQYYDDLGGPGRLESDLRQLFTVYGRLGLELQALDTAPDRISGQARIRGKGLEYQGPFVLEMSAVANGFALRAGLLTELRGILDTLRERRLAVEENSSRRLERMVSADYRSKQEDRTSLLAKADQKLPRGQVQGFIVETVDIRVENDKAEVHQTLLWILRDGSKKSEQKRQEVVRMQKEGSLWRITGGLG